MDDCEHSDLFSDDSDKDPDFDIDIYTKKMRGYLSDEEKKALSEQRQRKEQKKEKDLQEPRPYTSHRAEDDIGSKSVQDSERSLEKSDDEAEEDGQEEEEEEEEAGADDDDAESLDYTKLRQICLRVLTNAYQSATGARKQALRKKIEIAKKTQTPAEVELTYKQKIWSMEKELSTLKAEMKQEVASNKLFWKVATKVLPKRRKKVFTRARDVKSEGGRKPIQCPMPYCIAAVKYISRHLSHVHSVKSKSEQMAIMAKGKRIPQPQKGTKRTRKQAKRCSICMKVYKRVDCHLVHTHGLKRGSARFREIYRSSFPTSREGDTEDEPEAPTTEDDRPHCATHNRLKEFIDLYRNHLTNTSVLSASSISITTRIMGDLIKHSFEGENEDKLNGQSLIDTFLSLGDGKSFLRRRGDSLSGSYCCKIIFACRRAVGLLKDRKTPEPWTVERNMADEVDYVLQNLLTRYRKIEKAERATSREQKEVNMLSNSEIKTILTSPDVQNVLRKAADSLERDELRPITTKGFIKLRNALIMSFLVRSLRRAQEFTEFKVKEWKERSTNKKGTVIKIRKHKTMTFGSAEVVLNSIEERALKAYMMYARPLVTTCQADSCPVFLSSVLYGHANECCVGMNISNVTAILRKISLKAGVSSKVVNTRMMRRSIISSAWKRNTDPSFRQELAHLAGHSYETARRYYAVYDTRDQSRKIVTKLEEYREGVTASTSTKEMSEEEGLLGATADEELRLELLAENGQETIGVDEACAEGDTVLAPEPPCGVRNKSSDTSTTISPTTKSTFSTISSSKASDKSDISFMESEDESDELPASEFYKMVSKKQKEFSAKSGVKQFRWKTLRTALLKKHAYFEHHTTEQIRSRFKYIKSQLKIIK
ncbi:hypothetical protein E2C01_017132 [Portunus trituberculatus]|uniref:Tyr recombinase domain-containing protein n=1 Tax=Portunus trituberculatus TaxID=210409 RepID=A0A5B7DRI1_PORTR|nr:hypothetical protein [Portunus trituberculatus]